MREVSVVNSWVDPKHIVDLFFGMPQLGWTTPAPTMQLREAPPEYPIEAKKADCGNHNSKLISRCRPSGDDKLDRAAWEKTEEELSSEMILGPFFFDLQDVPFPIVRLLRRFGTSEQHGGAENPTVRLIDDALEGGQNGATGSQFTHRPTDLDSWATQCRMVHERFPQSALSQFPSDFKKKAYKQVPAKPRLAGFAVMVQWHPQKCCPAFLVGPTHFFGRKSCPVNRVPEWCCHALATMAGLATSHCVDDVLAVDRKTTIFSGWLVWHVLAACCGWVVPDAKSPLPSQVHRILGATSDLSQTPCGPPTHSISQNRVAQLTSMVKDVLKSGHLHPAVAGKLWGAWSSAALRCLDGLAGQNFVLFHVANMSMVGFG